jgi:hypothetical protein
LQFPFVLPTAIHLNIVFSSRGGGPALIVDGKISRSMRPPAGRNVERAPKDHRASRAVPLLRPQWPIE